MLHAVPGTSHRSFACRAGPIDAVGRVIYSDQLVGTSRLGRTLGITVPPGEIQIILYDVITGKRPREPANAGK